MIHDRNYLRMLSDSELRIYAKENTTTELEIALLERLERLTDAEEHLKDAKAEIEGLKAELEGLEAEIAILKAK